MFNKLILIVYLFTLPLFAQVDSVRENKIAIGPYVQKMTHKTVTLCWATLKGYSTITDTSGNSLEIPIYEQHETRLWKLSPKSEYSYNVLGDGSAEGSGSFTTFPKKIEPFRFVAFGDTRSGHESHQKVVNLIVEQEPILVINSGDLVNNGRDIHDWEQFFEVNKELMRNTPYFPVLGNHEKDSKHYFNFFDLPGNERYYHFDVGDALFIMLDVEGPNFNTPKFVKGKNRELLWQNYSLPYFKKQKEWLEHILSLHDEAGYIFVTSHEPYYTVRKDRAEETERRRNFWGDIFERYNVQVVFNGHDHHYHHALNNGTHYITTGGGGAPLSEKEIMIPETVKFSKVEHFISVDVGLDEATLNVIDINGDDLDKVVVKKRNSK